MPKAELVISQHDAIGSAARNAVAFHLRSLLPHLPGAKAGAVEPIHQIRVATRRLRATLRLFGPYLSAIKPHHPERQLKWIAGQAGSVRELDVIEALSRKRAGKLSPQLAKALEPLWREMRARRDENAAKLAAALESKRLRALVKLLSSTIPITPAGDAAFSALAPELIRPLLKSMTQAGVKMEKNPEPAAIHRLRVRAKRARYALETMRGMGGKRIAAVLGRLAELQDLLGRYHDAAVAVRWAEECAGSHPFPAPTMFAAGALTESLRGYERKLVRSVLAQWKEFSQTDPERAVLKALTRKTSTTRGAEVSVQ